jgi:hypothetical protein
LQRQNSRTQAQAKQASQGTRTQWNSVQVKHLEPSGNQSMEQQIITSEAVALNPASNLSKAVVETVSNGI